MSSEAATPAERDKEKFVFYDRAFIAMSVLVVCLCGFILYQMGQRNVSATVTISGKETVLKYPAGYLEVWQGGDLKAELKPDRDTEFESYNALYEQNRHQLAFTQGNKDFITALFQIVSVLGIVILVPYFNRRAQDKAAEIQREQLEIQNRNQREQLATQNRNASEQARKNSVLKFTQEWVSELRRNVAIFVADMDTLNINLGSIRDKSIRMNKLDTADPINQDKFMTLNTSVSELKGNTLNLYDKAMQGESMIKLYLDSSNREHLDWITSLVEFLLMNSEPLPKEPERVEDLVKHLDEYLAKRDRFTEYSAAQLKRELEKAQL